ncbi:MAG TPA: hypothetical protein VMH28_03040, partial [Candidatus Acidoferrales bacterium]|nr:hypothetical protein [Candidatus Acidoferrales bacterium]
MRSETHPGRQVQLRTKSLSRQPGTFRADRKITTGGHNRAPDSGRNKRSPMVRSSIAMPRGEYGYDAPYALAMSRRGTDGRGTQVDHRPGDRRRYLE